MSPAARWFKVGFVFLVVVFAGRRMATARIASAESPKSVSCATPEYRQFDDVFDVGSPIKVAHVRVDLILDGCVLREDYQGTDGHKGQSFTIYVQIDEPIFQSGFILLPRHAIDSGRSLTLECVKALAE